MKDVENAADARQPGDAQEDSVATSLNPVRRFLAPKNTASSVPQMFNNTLANSAKHVPTGKRHAKIAVKPKAHK